MARWLATFGALLIGLSTLHAADPDVFMPDGKTRVTYDPMRKQNKVVRIAYKDFVPLSQPGGNRGSGAKKIEWMQRMQVIGDFEQGIQGKGNYYPVSSYPDNIPQGWVPKEVIIDKPTCMADENGIQIKAMVINSLAYLTNKNIPKDQRLPPPLIQLAPHTHADNIGPFRFFDFYFVWADTDISHPDQGYVLLGDRNTYNPNNEPSISADGFSNYSKIRGWVDKSRLCFWRTREAVQWNDHNLKRTEPVRAYATPEQALADFNGTHTPAKIAGQLAFVEEEFDRNHKPVRWEPWRMRYPILASADVNDQKQESWSSKSYRRDRDGKNNILYRVGVIGDVFSDDGKMIFSGKDRSAFKKDLEDTMEQINTLQILFVIDRTASMEDWWEETANSVKKLMNQVARDGRDVSIAFCYYGDVWQDGQEGKITNYKIAIEKGGVFPGKFFNASDTNNLNKELTILRDPKQVKIAGKRMEMLYAGLEAGLYESGTWKAKARKMVVLIGDDGNHIFEKKIENDILDRLANFCARGGTKLPKRIGEEIRTPIEFYALQVADVPRRAAEDDPRLLFQAQIQNLCTQINQRTEGKRAAYFNPRTSKTDFHKLIDARYIELQNAADEIREWMTKAKTGQVKTRFEIKNRDAQAIIMELAERHNPKNPDAIFEGSQVFESRFVWLTGPRTGDQLREPQLRKMILVSDGELHLILSRLENFFEQVENPPTLEQVASALIEVHSGSLNDPEDRKAFMKLGIATQLQQIKAARGFEFAGKLTRFLGYDKQDGASAAPTPQERDQFLRDMRYRYYILKGIRTDKIYVDKGNNKWVIETPADYEPRGFDREQKSRKSNSDDAGGGNANSPRAGIWYWIDADEEWL